MCALLIEQLSCVGSLLGCQPSLVSMMAIIAVTLSWNIALLACQLYQVNMSGVFISCLNMSKYLNVRFCTSR